MPSVAFCLRPLKASLVQGWVGPEVVCDQCRSWNGDQKETGGTSSPQKLQLQSGAKFTYQTIKSAKKTFVLLLSPPPPYAMLHSCYSWTLRNARNRFSQHCMGEAGSKNTGFVLSQIREIRAIIWAVPPLFALDCLISFKGHINNLICSAIVQNNNRKVDKTCWWRHHDIS